MPLLIIESGNKIPKLKKILGPDWTIMCTVGHFKELSKKNMGIDASTWLGSYQITESKKDIVKKIQEEAKKHDDIYVGSDPDLEGHKISFDIKDILPKNKNIQRITFEEINKTALLSAIKNPSGFDKVKLAAQEARRFSDRLVGFGFSPLLWAKAGLKSTSVGRCQSVALKWIVEREREIRKFEKQEYWSILAETAEKFDAEFYGINKEKVVPKSKSEVDKILKDITGDLVVSEYQAKTRSRSPSAPFITATVQIECSNKFSWTAKRTLDELNSLYSKGMITYPRTDSVKIESAKLIEIRKEVEQKFGKQYLHPEVRQYENSDNSQEAHECIRYSGEPIPSDLGTDEQKLLDLIIDRTLASQMADCLFDQTLVTLEYKNKDSYLFKASGSILKFDGFLKVVGNSSKDNILPTLKKGQKIKVNKFTPTQHFTKPPARYNDSSLITKLKDTGVGRPSTYASIPETLLSHQYVTRDKKNLQSTELGEMVFDYINAFFSDVVNEDFTAKMEKDLDKIKNGEYSLKQVMDPFYIWLNKQIDTAKEGNAKEVYKTETDCPKCADGSKMIKRISEHGLYLSCINYPKCNHTFNFAADGKLVSGKEETEFACPECTGKLVQRESKFGKFLSCGNYPTCKYTAGLDADGKIKEKKKVETTDTKCDKCSDGMMVKRAGKDGSSFLGCSKYPNCKNTMNIDADGNITAKKEFTGTKKKATSAKSTGKKCPKCKKNDLAEREGKFGKFISCLGYPTCKYIQK